MFRLLYLHRMLALIRNFISLQMKQTLILLVFHLKGIGLGGYRSYLFLLRVMFYSIMSTNDAIVSRVLWIILLAMWCATWGLQPEFAFCLHSCWYHRHKRDVQNIYSWNIFLWWEGKDCYKTINGEEWSENQIVNFAVCMPRSIALLQLLFWC